MTEKELVARAKTDVAAFEKLYEKHFPAIFRYVMMRVQNRDYAEEIVSNVFFKAMQKISLFKWKSIPFSAWLYRIAISEISNYFRKAKKQTKIKDSYVEKEDIAQYERSYDYDFIKEYIDKLPQKDQEIIILRYFENKSFQDISQILRIRENTLRVNLHRALKKLEKLIPKEVLENVYRQVS
ncbi:MAG: hypothetical protein CSB55_02740 [Candidatus Cloacimonadota bacterium]|nr:MAG: hypothetical protein CSB55_02740 [Candidatus Cloacimonadota bacterium]